MSAVGSKLRRWRHTGLGFWCPGCNSAHAISDEPGRWTFNGDGDRPTFSPSVKVEGWLSDELGVGTCHSFVRDGNIQFLDDCTHGLAGKTVPLPDWPSGE